MESEASRPDPRRIVDAQLLAEHGSSVGSEDGPRCHYIYRRIAEPTFPKSRTALSRPSWTRRFTLRRSPCVHTGDPFQAAPSPRDLPGSGHHFGVEDVVERFDRGSRFTVSHGQWPVSLGTVVPRWDRTAQIGHKPEQGRRPLHVSSTSGVRSNVSPSSHV